MSTEQRNGWIARYAAGFEAVQEALSGFTPEMLTIRLFEGKWSAAEIIQHLADSEMQSALRLRKLLTEDFPVIYGYDQEVYAARLHYNERDIVPALDVFRGARATSLQLLKRLSEDDWQRAGWHTEQGRYTVENWLEIYSAHAHNHAEQIIRLHDALKSSS